MNSVVIVTDVLNWPPQESLAYSVHCVHVHVLYCTCVHLHVQYCMCVPYMYMYITCICYTSTVLFVNVHVHVLLLFCPSFLLPSPSLLSPLNLLAPPVAAEEKTDLEGTCTVHVWSGTQYTWTCSIMVCSIIAELLEKGWDTTEEEEEVIPKKKNNSPKPLPGE